MTDHEATSRRPSNSLDQPDKDERAVRPILVETARCKSGTTPTKAMVTATRSCLRSLLITPTDANPCATVMPLPLAVPPATARPEIGLRVFCGPDPLSLSSHPDEAASAITVALPDASRDELTSEADKSASQSSSPRNRRSSGNLDRNSGDVFLSASIQLSHLQSDVHQRVRQLWHTVQRLRWENQISNTAVDALHKEMLVLSKCASAEKLDSSKFTKTGYLKLVQAPLLVTSALKQQSVKALFGPNVAKPVSQLVWCALSEEQATFEMGPVREAPGTTSSTPPQSTPGGKATLTNSLMGIFNDAFQAADQEGIRRTLIKLHGCHVRTVSAATGVVGVDESGKTSDATNRFQILVPHCDAISRTGGSQPHAARAISYDIYVFETVAGEGSASSLSGGEHDESCAETCNISSWVRAIDRVCMFHLYKLEERVRGVEAAADYRDVLSRSFPLAVPLSWLRNRQDRVESYGAGGESASHHQEEQRRASRNVTMVQIMKDLERDRVLLDQRLLCPADSLSTPSADGDVSSAPATLDTVSEIFKYLVMKVMASSIPPIGSTGSPRTAPSSPSRRFVGFNEAKAVAFVERVLRGCSRTQSGGDIYDAISFLCQHHRVSICPLSQEACPIEISTPEQDGCVGGFHVEVKVSMRFKVIELTPTTPNSSRTAKKAASGDADEGQRDEGEPPARQRRDSLQRRNSLQRRDSLREWAIVEGTLIRHFAPGKASTPGSVTVDFVQREGR